MSRGEELERRIVDALRGSEAQSLADLARALGFEKDRRPTVLAALKRLQGQEVVEQLPSKLWRLLPLTKVDERILRAYADPDANEATIRSGLQSKLRGRDLNELLKGLVSKGHLHAPRPRYAQPGILAGAKASTIGGLARGATIGGLLQGFQEVLDSGRHRLTRAGAATIGACPDCGREIQQGEPAIVDATWRADAPTTASHAACRGHGHVQGPFCAVCGLSATLEELGPRPIGARALWTALTLHEQHAYNDLERRSRDVDYEDLRRERYEPLIDLVAALGQMHKRKGKTTSEEEARYAQRAIAQAIKADLAARHEVEELVALLHAVPIAHREALPPEDWRKRAHDIWVAAHATRSHELAEVARVRAAAQGLAGAIFHYSAWPPPRSTQRELDATHRHDTPPSQAVMVRGPGGWYHAGCYHTLHGESKADEHPKAKPAKEVKRDGSK